MLQYFLTDIVEYITIVDWLLPIGTVRAPITSMEAELFYLAGVRIAQTHLLALHLHDVFGALSDLLIIEGTYTDYDFDAVCHMLYFR
jgi:hypothetical protein